MADPRIRTGGCLCGAVRYEITVEPGPVSFCHCSQCRRQHSHVGAYTTFPREGLRMVTDGGLSWFRSSDRARRGFCRICGAGLFWAGDGNDRVEVTAGSLDEPTGLRAERHIYVDSKADWYDIGTDGLRREGEGTPGVPAGS